MEKQHHHWVSHILGIKEKPVYAHVDIGLKEKAPLKTYPYLLCVTVNILYPNVKGLILKTEEAQLEIIEKVIMEKIKIMNSILVGKTIGNSLKKFFFYTELIQNFNKFKEAVRTSFPDYNFDFISEKDASWLFYKDKMYPDEWQMQLITNYDLVQNLKKLGDSLKKARLVEHTLYFSAKTDIKSFSKDAQNSGFKISEVTIYENKKMPYLLNISRVDKADFNSINQVVREVYNLIAKYHVEYDGWECEVIKYNK